MVGSGLIATPIEYEAVALPLYILTTRLWPYPYRLRGCGPTHIDYESVAMSGRGYGVLTMIHASGHYMARLWTLYGRALDTLWKGSGHYMAGRWTLYGRALDTIYVRRPQYL